MANLPYMPPEMLAEYAAEARRQRIAEAMMAGNMAGYGQTQFTPGKYAQAIPSSFGEGLARIGAVGLNQYTSNQADAAQKALAERATQQQDAAMAALQNDPKTQLPIALAHANPTIRAAAAALQKRQDELEKERLAREWDLLKGRTDALGKVDAPAAYQLISGGQAPANVSWQQPRVEAVSDPTRPGGQMAQVTNYGEGGRPTASFQQPGVNITNTLGKDEGKALIDLNAEELKGARDLARTAQQSIGNVNRIISAFEAGAKAGGKESWILEAQKFGQLFNVNIPSTGATEEVKMALQEGVLNKAKALRPVSNDEVKFLQQMVGSIDTDPAALANLLAWYQANSLFEIQTFQRLKAAQMNASSPELRQKYETVGLGIELPKELRGPKWMQFKTMELLDMIGGDVSQYKDSAQGDPMVPGATYKIGTPSSGLVRPASPQGSKGKALVDFWSQQK